MKKRKLYYLEDILNLIFFYSIFATLLAVAIIKTVEFCNGSLAWQKLLFDWLMVVLMIVPYLVKKIFRLKISRILTCLFYFIIFASAFLGRTIGLYSMWSEYDTLLHFLCGIYAGIFGASLFMLLNKGNYKNKAFMYAFMIFFVMFVGSCWEIFRYVISVVFYSSPLDGTGLLDAITDLSADLMGGVVAIFTTFFATKIRADFPATIQIQKLRPSEVEIEEIEE